MPRGKRLVARLATLLSFSALAILVSAGVVPPRPGAPAALALPPASQSGLTPRVVVPMLVRAGDVPTPLAAPAPARPVPPSQLAASPTPAAATAASAPSRSAPDGIETDLFAGMNAERAARGLGPLVLDATLTTIARTRSQQMASEGYFGHVDPRGRRPYIDLLAQSGVTYRLAGENLALNNYPAPEAASRALTSLMASTSHRENILEERFTRVGVGVVTTADGKHYLTAIFTG